MRQFGELSPDLIDMQRYAAWKAADIRKALREGRQPTAGNPAGAASAEQELLDDLGLPSVPGMQRTAPSHTWSSRCMRASMRRTKVLAKSRLGMSMSECGTAVT